MASHLTWKFKQPRRQDIRPHVAWASREAMQILADQLINNIEAYVRGTPQNLVT